MEQRGKIFVWLDGWRWPVPVFLVLGDQFIQCCLPQSVWNQNLQTIIGLFDSVRNLDRLEDQGAGGDPRLIPAVEDDLVVGRFLSVRVHGRKGSGWKIFVRFMIW